MGLFSKTCAKTHLPILCHFAWGQDAPRLTHIVVLEPGREPFEAHYDGYGLGLSDYDEAKFVLASDYRGERYEDLPASDDEPNQGYFHIEQFIRALAGHPGFASYEAYEDALSAFERGYDETSASVLNALDIPFEPKNVFRTARVLQQLNDSADRVPDNLFSGTPLPAGKSLDELRELAKRYATEMNSRLEALASQVLAG